MRNVLKEDLYIIKKKYGEKMMHLCRSLFPTILETSGLLSNLILSHFESSHQLYDDIVKENAIDLFRDYIYGLLTADTMIKLDINKSPFELLDEAGYILYECKTEEDVQSFRKYYKPFEELCTFGDKRIERCHVFFAVKKNVDKIRREDFLNPKRQDEYGTSVISIQFTRGKTNILSIKNRYNDAVRDPDSTFYNNLDNIIPGLMESFYREYKFNYISYDNKFKLNNYVQTIDGKFYKYNYKINDIYYCPNNVIIENNRIVSKYKEMEKYIVADYFIIDLVNKRIELYDNKVRDCFHTTFNDIKKINIIKEKNNGNKTIEVFYDDNKCATIVVDSRNRIVGYHNEYLTEINNVFLYYNQVLEAINVPNIIMIGNGFLRNNTKLKSFKALKLLNVGNEFLRSNTDGLTTLITPLLEKIGNSFLYYNNSVSELDLSRVTQVGNGFMYLNRVMVRLIMSSLASVGSNFLPHNDTLNEVILSREIVDKINNSRIKELLSGRVGGVYKR